MRALAHVDRQGRFRARDRAAVREQVAQYRSGALAPVDHPADLFGPWETLPEPVQVAFRTLVERDISGTMRWFPHGALWTGAIRRCWEGDRYIAEQKRFRPLRRHLIVLANRLTALPMNARRRVLAWGRRQLWDRRMRCSLGTLLTALGRDAHWLCGDFVEGVRVAGSALGFHAEVRRNAVVGYHIGLDLMPTAEGMVCLEGNLQVGFLTRRPTIQPHNPTGHAMIAAARAHGVREIAWVEGHRIPLPGWFIRQLSDLGRPHGIGARFYQDPRVPRRRDLPTATEADPVRRPWLAPVPTDTLVVRRNEFPVGSDFVINHKEPFVRALHACFSRQPDGVVQVLPQTRHAEIAPGSFERGLPNVVYKYPDGLSGTGVFFMRVRTPEAAERLAREIDARTGEAPGLFQRFVAPNPSATGSARDYRAEILITPMGTWFLGAIRRVAGQALPSRVPEGLVESAGVFTSNMSTGGVIESTTDAELAQLEPAAIAVGDALREVLTRTFDAGDPMPTSTPVRVPQQETPAPVAAVARDMGASV
jgi:hypothetical protein